MYDIWWYISEAYGEFSEQQKKDLHLLGCDWALTSIDNFEKEFPGDDRPRKAIEAKKLWLDGKVTDEELSAAGSAARAAAWSAARSAAWSAAWSARSAAESAARSAAESAAMEKFASELMQLFKSWES